MFFNVSQKKISALSLKHFKKTSYICTKSLKSNNKANYKRMGYTNKEKLEWTMIFIHEFAEKNGLNMKQSFGYLSRFKGIDFIDNHYGYVHTQSFESMIEEITALCYRNGGRLK